MKVSKSSITYHASVGRLTIQVPMIDIGGPPMDIIDLPDEFFILFKTSGSGNRICFGRERPYGFVGLSRNGFEIFKNDMVNAYVARVNNNHTQNPLTIRDEYIQAIYDIYDDIDIRTAKEAVRRGFI